MDNSHQSGSTATRTRYKTQGGTNKGRDFCADFRQMMGERRGRLQLNNN